jgi:M6 family metalloprotease-like protein
MQSRRSLVIILVAAVFLGSPVFTRAASPESIYYEFFPSKGAPRLLAILVETSDRPATLSAEQVEMILFSREDDGVVSMAEYYDEVSYGALRIQGEVTPWLKLTKPVSQYAGNSYGLNVRTWPRNLGGFAYDAINAALESGIDLAPYDNSGDGHVDGLMIIHSGPDAGLRKRKDLLWSRIDYISMYGGEPMKVEGRLVDRFGVCAEYIISGRPDGMRLFAHELGHMMGLPDFYDRDRSSLGIGANGLMGMLITPKAMVLPPAPTAYSRMLLGWVEPKLVDGDTIVILKPAASAPDVIRLDSGNPGEYFLLEYRKKAGMDAGLAGEGILLWHVNERAVYNNLFECAGLCELTPRLRLVQADGRNDLENKRKLADPEDFFPGPDGRATSVGADTGDRKKPFQGANTLAFNGLPTGIRISDIAVGRESARAGIDTVDPATPVIDYPWLFLAGRKWRELVGDGDGFPEPGEKLSLELEIVNVGLRAKRIKLTATHPYVKWSRKKVRISRLEPGEKKTASFILTVPADQGSVVKRTLVSAFTDYKGATPGAAQKDPGPQPGATVSGLAALAAESGVSWFKPVIKARVGRPWMETEFTPRMVMGAPPLLIVDDAPRDLIPYLDKVMESLKVPYAAVDVFREGLPDKKKAIACPVVLWLCGTRAVDGSDFPDRERMELMRAIIGAGHTLVISVCRIERPPSADLMDLLGVSEMSPAAGISFARPAPGASLRRGLFFRRPYPYYPSLNPHLALEPGPGSRVLLRDLRGAPAAVIKESPGGGADGSGASSRPSAVLLGFPFEALKPDSTRRLLEALGRRINEQVM